MKQIFFLFLMGSFAAQAQNNLTPETLWSLKRVSAEEISKSGKTLFYSEKQYDYTTEKSVTKHYKLNIAKGTVAEIIPVPNVKKTYEVITSKGKEGIELNTEGVENVKVSPDKKYIAFTKEVLITPMNGSDIHKDLPKTTMQVYTDLIYRHWDTWEDGKYSHVFIMNPETGDIKDIQLNEPYDCPQKPFGGDEDFVFTPDGKGIVYVSKKKVGKEYAQSTNTDIYYYDFKSGTTTNWTANMMGYDMAPLFSPDGKRMAWTSMRRDGFEADKTDIYVMDLGSKDAYKVNLTGHWDGTIESFVWDSTSTRIFFNAPWKGTVQLFEVGVPANLYSKILPAVHKITDGVFDIAGIKGQAKRGLVVSRTDMNHAAELYLVNTEDGSMKQLTHANDEAYSKIGMSKTELRMVKTTDGKQMGVWVIYPPDFNPKKKYPTLLYCQGGPQSALSQFYSYRWNFQLMAANGYIVVAPNRRGMPGWGVQWNEDISKDWGGQPMRDYLAAIDAVAEEKFVDKNRLGCVGASYGGYSVFMLAGMHENRFKTFIAHDGLFDLKSWYGTTEELWFANWDIEGAYWNKPVPKSYELFNPSNFIAKWNTPIMIIQGGIDYRVPIEQGLEAFQAAQLKGIKSKLLYFPNENHWILHPQNGVAWHREFYKWLDETLK
ncbi:MAG: S9 family peptidase [Bacteroidetes bacterium]|nr:S9 family peptidase [Bacteroidota bacterium]